MKKKAIRKLNLSKINIASLNAGGQAKIHGGLKRTTVDDTISSDVTSDTRETFCVFCVETRRAC